MQHDKKWYKPARRPIPGSSRGAVDRVTDDCSQGGSPRSSFVRPSSARPHGVPVPVAPQMPHMPQVAVPNPTTPRNGTLLGNLPAHLSSVCPHAPMDSSVELGDLYPFQSVKSEKRDQPPERSHTPPEVAPIPCVSPATLGGHQGLPAAAVGSDACLALCAPNVTTNGVASAEHEDPGCSVQSTIEREVSLEHLMQPESCALPPMPTVPSALVVAWDTVQSVFQCPELLLNAVGGDPGGQRAVVPFETPLGANTCNGTSRSTGEPPDRVSAPYVMREAVPGGSAPVANLGQAGVSSAVPRSAAKVHVFVQTICF